MADLVVEQRGHVLWITLNRPEVRNALCRSLNLELGEVAENVIGREDVHAVVITGAGEVFSAGADLKERRGITARESEQYVSAISNAINAVGSIRRPTIAAMNGSAYGGGLELALACDFRILVDTAEVGLTEVRLGIMPGAGGTQRLPRLIGEARAKEMILLGRKIPARRALELGVVTQLVPSGQLGSAVDAMLAEIEGCAPLSVEAAKIAIEKGHTKSMEEGLELEREKYEVTLYSDDRNEGLAAFAEKRPPRYQGR